MSVPAKPRVHPAARLLFPGAFALLAMTSACRRTPAPVPPPAPAAQVLQPSVPPPPPPVVHVAPIAAQPYEEGYNLGYSEGEHDSAPRARPPGEEALEAKGVARAGLDPDRPLKWQRGWVAGYLDGWRSVSQNLK